MNKEIKLKLLKATLYMGAVYYLIGSVVHYFGLTLFPWFDGTPYHDTIISLVAVVLALFLVVIAKDLVKNIDTPQQSFPPQGWAGGENIFLVF